MNGVPVPVVSRLLGHSDVRTTLRYAHLGDREIEDAAERVDRDRLVLADGKTGPRIVPLNTQARRILERRPRGRSPFVFPSPRDPARPAAATCRSGAAPGARRTSRTFGFTISGIPMPATR